MTSEGNVVEQPHKEQSDSEKSSQEWVDLPEFESTKAFPGLFPWM